MKICPYCQTKLTEDELFCSQCGKKYVAPVIQQNQQNQQNYQNQQNQQKKKSSKKPWLILVAVAVVVALVAGAVAAVLLLSDDSSQSPSADKDRNDENGDGELMISDSSSTSYGGDFESFAVSEDGSLEEPSEEESLEEDTTYPEESGEEEEDNTYPDESSEDPFPEKNPYAIPTFGENVAAGKTYEISEQFRIGGPDVGWGYDINAAVSYPDYNYELTDGYVPTNDDAYTADCWMAFNRSTPEQEERGYAFVKISLGELYEISEISVCVLKDIATGINSPYIIEVLVSEDNETFASAGRLELTRKELDGLTDKAVHTLVAELDCTARYLEIRVTSYGWAFLGEIEVK